MSPLCSSVETPTRSDDGQHAHHLSEFSDRIVDANRSILNDSGVDATQVQLDPYCRVHKRGRVPAKSRRELLATSMGRRGHFQHSGANLNARSGRSVGRAQIKVHEQLVSCEWPAIFATSQDGNDASIHDRELLVWI